jgi:hypothetical protein
MIHEGQVVLFRFPFADRKNGKLRPSLIIQLSAFSFELSAIYAQNQAL